ncbi:MAG: hypothetical protein WC289_06030 [Patescibacteria group bacterium]|jgi:hypothetical protein
MSYPLIILGAGASHDFADNKKLSPHYQPPLAKFLFNEESYHGLLNSYPRVAQLASTINPLLRNPKNNFETTLGNIAKQQESRLEIKKQLTELRYYLRELFFETSTRYYRATNHYAALIERVRNVVLPDGGSTKVVYVSYNYDTLLERSFGIENFQELSSYISGLEIIVKLHGSHNWGYEIKNSHGPIAGDLQDRVINEPILFQKAEEGQLLVVDDESYHNPAERKLPAIAIPINDKSRQYICDTSHIKALDNELAMVDRVIIIGWQGADTFLLEKIKRTGKFFPTIYIKDKKPSIFETEGILKYFEKYNLKIEKTDGIFFGGFSAFLETTQLERFLEQ